MAVSADVMRALQGALMFDSGTNLAAVAVVDLLSCLTLRDPMDCSLPGSSVQGILQNSRERILEWVPIAFCNGIEPRQLDDRYRVHLS